PNKGSFCICRDGSYGTMVACENDSCPIEWFHIGCMGMEKAPAQTAVWYCPEC
ncbi:uncharacterized protein BDZ99DRAFT_360737, partial [Mytilinidion resinicola]